MNTAIEYVAFRLKKDVTEEAFIPVSDRFNEEFLKKQKGYIARKILKDGDIWADLVLWQEAADHINAMKVAEYDEAARAYLSMLNLSAKGSSYHLYESIKSYDWQAAK